MESEDVPVFRVRARMPNPGPAAAFEELESKLGTMKGRRFYGTMWMTDSGPEYQACVARVATDDPSLLQLAEGVIPGGRYARRRFPDWEKNLARLPAEFEEMIRSHSSEYDPTRPCIEFYRSQSELLMLVPVRRSTHPSTAAGSRSPQS